MKGKTNVSMGVMSATTAQTKAAKAWLAARSEELESA
jgi:hypothetical protein